MERGGSGEPLNPPIHLSVTYRYKLEALAGRVDELGEVKYSRENNPTVMELEERLARIEDAGWSLAFNTGMAALATLLTLHSRRMRGRLVLQRLVYGSTRALAETLYDRSRLIVAGPPWDELLAAADHPETTMVLVETIANPTLRVPPLDELARICGERGCILAVDNTMATPVLFKPLASGAELVVESLSKYIVGYNDALGGVVAGRSEQLHRELWRLRKLMGTILQPFEAYQAIRGLYTLKLRVLKASETAMKVARWLEESGLAERVYYPGLPSHPDHKTARRLLQGGYGGVVTFDLGSRDQALKLLSRLQRITPSTSFGTVQPVASYPYASSHRNLPEDEKRKLGITPGLVRLNVGTADPDEIIEDLEKALRK